MTDSRRIKGYSVKNNDDALIVSQSELLFTYAICFWVKQIALIRHEKLFEISRAVLRDKSLRKED